MKYVNRIPVALCLSISLLVAGCDDSDEKPVVALQATEVKDINAVSSKNFTLFSFATNGAVSNTDSASTKWDIGFRGTTIIVNGGVSGPGGTEGQIVDGIFDELAEAPVSGYTTDSQSAKAIPGSGWYTYTGEATPPAPQHAILPIAGKILVFKTADGKFAKVEVVSYYQGNPDTTTASFADLATRPASRYYTFRFIYQPDGTTNLTVTK